MWWAGGGHRGAVLAGHKKVGHHPFLRPQLVARLTTVTAMTTKGRQGGLVDWLPLRFAHVSVVNPDKQRQPVLVEQLVQGDRRALAKAITLVESSHKEQQRQGWHLVSSVAELTRNRTHDQNGRRITPTFRLGISGSPGVGKSTFIEALGSHIVLQGHKLAVLAVDPSSTQTKGSILADKTRMTQLARHHHVFIRPSPSSGTLGGVARATAESIALCEGAGYSVVIIETVGVGQSEVAVGDMVDMMAVLIGPGAGDELQAMKRGIMERADAVIITKADGDFQIQARRTLAQYRSILQLLPSRSALWSPPVLLCSALNHTNIDTVWTTLVRFRDIMHGHNELEKKRAAQRVNWLWRILEDELMQRFKGDQQVAEHLQNTQNAVLVGDISVEEAAFRLLDCFAPPRT
eukprot:TRINITY_DN2596_c3_g1_i3.p1 TRINITY_DN2596_c3_g1~~TRINITY_DN2596_c3_g1_i3.p1  ORF type:complete len:405 (+),score=46.58 TRINITY_DN2596_c3_g1_i3:56-1270(+)